MIKFIPLAWLLLSLCQQASAQQGYPLRGIVVDAATQRPIVGANIISGTLYAVSSEQGEFTIPNMPRGTHELEITHIGYSKEYLTVVVVGPLADIVISLKGTVTDLAEVELIGKTQQRQLRELPSTTVQVSGQFLDQNRENSLMQTLAKIPGVGTISIGSGQSKPLIRGLGFNRVIVVQNGIKHEAQQWGSDHSLEIDQYGIDKVRIIKGPASLLYGSDAIAGVVDIPPPVIPMQNSFEGEVNVLGETNNALFGLSSGIRARKEKWYYRGRLTFRDYGDYKVPTDQIEYQSYNIGLHKNRLRNTAGMEGNASFSLGFLSERIKSETFIGNVYAKNGFFANAHGLEFRTSSIDYDRYDRDVDLPHHKVNHFKIINNTTFHLGEHTLKLDLGYQNNHREEHSEPVPHGYMPTPPDSRERIFDKNTYSLNLSDRFRPSAAHDLVFGLNAEFQDNNIGGWGFLIPEYKRFTLGALAYGQFEIGGGLHLMGGIRYDLGLVDTKSYFDWYPSPQNNADGTISHIHRQRAQDRNMQFGSFSGSIGMSHSMGNTTYKINLGKSFRMPLASELASDGVNYHMYRYELGNIDLDPEQSYQLDLEVDHTTTKFNVVISPFINFFENFIYLNPSPVYYQTLQIYGYTQARVLRFGGEVQAGVQLTTALRLEASAEYVRSRQESGPKKGFTLPFAPPLSGLFSVSHRSNDFLIFKQPLIRADLKLTASQNHIVPPEEKTPGYQVLDLSAQCGIPLFKRERAAELRIKLNNVLDTEYYDHTSYYRLIDVPQAGRNLSVSLTVPF